MVHSGMYCLNRWAGLILLVGLGLLAPSSSAQTLAPPYFETIQLHDKALAKPEGQEIMRTHGALRQAVAAGSPDALPLARQLVRQTRKAYGVSNRPYARALTNLAFVLLVGNEHAEAAEQYMAAIEAHRRACARSCARRFEAGFSTFLPNDLVNPLRGLTLAYDANGDTERAQIAFLRAEYILERGISMLIRTQDAAAPEFEWLDLDEEERQTRMGGQVASVQRALQHSVRVDAPRAVEEAKVLVGLTNEVYGDSHPYFAKAITNLAIMQARQGEFDAAILNYEAAIQAHERIAGNIVANDLINPLHGLASAYLATNNTDAATVTSQRAVHVSHVNQGPRNQDQIKGLHALAGAQLLAGDTEALEEVQKTKRLLLERKLDASLSRADDAAQMLAGLQGKAVWYARLGSFMTSSAYYRRLIDEMTQRYGTDDTRLIEPLLSLAETVVRSRALLRLGVSPVLQAQQAATTVNLSAVTPGEGVRAADRQDRATLLLEYQGRIEEGRRAMARAITIARQHALHDPARLALTLVRFGDWQRALEQFEASLAAHREAYELLDQMPALHELRDEVFGAPVPVVRYPLRPIYVERTSHGETIANYAQRGHVDITLDVDATGKPINVRIVDASPIGLMEDHVLFQVSRFRFRPRLIGGDPAAYDGLRIRHVFRYDDSRLTDGERDPVNTDVARIMNAEQRYSVAANRLP